MRSLLFAEHRLAEMVDVHAHALLTSFVQMLVQGIVFAGDYRPAAARTHLFNELGYGQGGKMPAQSHKHLDGQLLHPAEKFRHPIFMQKITDLICHPLGVTGTKALVNELT